MAVLWSWDGYRFTEQEAVGLCLHVVVNVVPQQPMWMPRGRRDPGGPGISGMTGSPLAGISNVPSSLTSCRVSLCGAPVPSPVARFGRPGGLGLPLVNGERASVSR